MRPTIIFCTLFFCAPLIACGDACEEPKSNNPIPKQIEDDWHVDNFEDTPKDIEDLPDLPTAKETVCDNDLDDDGDGLPDCADDDCIADTYCQNVPSDPQVASIVPGATFSLVDLIDAMTTGTPPIQQQVDPSTLHPNDVALIRGLVLNRQGQPIAGARVDVLEQPERGFTYTRSDGKFDLLVPGANRYMIRIVKDNHPTVYRKAYARYGKITWIDDARLTPLASESTTINMDNGGIIAGQSKQDRHGTRRPVVYLPPNTTAEFELWDGSRQSAPKELTFRLTEYTTNEDGPDAMPGPLPSTSAYTYAIEINADEAIEANARHIHFNQLVPYYVDNFLDFPVGTAVPLGIFDPVEGWVPGQDGLVIKVLSTDGQRITVDYDGDDMPDDPMRLPGATDQEWIDMAQHLQQGQSYWRVASTQLSPHDLNWFYSIVPPQFRPRPGFELASNRKSKRRPFWGEDCEKNGSIIDCQKQTVRDNITLPGTLYTATVGTTGDAPTTSIAFDPWDTYRKLEALNTPNALRYFYGIKISVLFAGHRHEAFYGSDQTDQKPRFEYILPQQDAWGRSLDGQSITAAVVLSYIYATDYTYGEGTTEVIRRSFASYLPSQETTVVQANGRVLNFASSRKSVVVDLTNKNSRPQINVHHRFDRDTNTIFYGDGTSDQLNPAQLQVGYKTTPCKNCYDPPLDNPEEALPLNWFSQPETFISPGGQRLAFYGAVPLYVDGEPDNPNRYIQKRFDVLVSYTPNGEQTIIWKQPYDNNITYNQPRMSRMGAELYMLKRQSDTRTTTVEKININGGQSTSVLTINEHTPDAPMRDIYHWDIHPNGRMIYVLGQARSTERGSYDVMRQYDLVNHTVQDIYDASQNDRFAVDDITVRIGRKFVINSRGDLIFESISNIDSGVFTATTVLVKLTGFNQFDAFAGYRPALLASADKLESAIISIPSIRKMTINKADIIHLYTTQNTNQFPHIIQLDEDYGLVVMGNPDGGQTLCSEPTSTGIPPVSCKLSGLEQFFGGTASGDVYMLSGNTIMGRKNRWAFDTQLGGVRVPALNHDQWYVFAPDGRILQTEDGHTGAVIRNFEYNEQKQLVAIEEMAPKWRTELTWEGHRLTSIKAPGNRVTAFTYNELEQLTAVINPNMTTIEWTFTPEGLIKSRRDPDGGQKTYDYEQNRLVQSTLKDNAGRQQLAQMTDQDGALVTTFTDARGLQTTYRQQTNEGGQSTLTTTHPNASTTRVEWNAASFTKTSPTGMKLHRPLLDLGSIQASNGATKGLVKRYTKSTPSDKQINVFQKETFRFESSENKVSTWEKQLRHAGGGITAIWTQQYDAAQREMRWTTPNGQSFSERYNENNQLIERTYDANTTAVTAQYDPQGLLSQLTQGNQQWQYTWDGIYLANKTNAMGHTHRFAYTPNGELRTRTMPEQQVYTYGRDSMGRLNELTMPKGGKHNWTYNQYGNTTRYTPPGKLPTQWSYQTGHVLKDTTQPDGRVISMSYDASTGELAMRQSPDFTINYTYHPSGQISRVTRQQMDGQSVEEHYKYDGDLLTDKTTRFGAQSSYNAQWTYDGLWRATAVTVNGTNLAMGRDKAGMLTQIGGWQVTRNGPAKSVSSMVRGTMQQQLEYDAVGHLTQRRLQRGASTLFGYTVIKDNAGRAIRIDERIGNETQSKQYTYDDNGRLLTVTQNNVTEAQYSWDDNGNITNFNGAQVTYDDADEITSWANKTVEHDVNGHIKTLGDWRLTYDAQGNLTAGVHNDGRRIELLYDGIGRLVSRTKDNQSHRFLYNNLASPFQVTQIISPTGQMTHLIYDEMNHLMEIKGPTTLIVGTDNIGSPRIWTTSTGTIQKQTDYTAFGQIKQSSSTQWTWIGFAGALRDPDLPLLRFGLRHYAPELGRWLTRDPSSFEGSPNNLYSYVEGNPITFRDPNGLFCVGGSIYTGIGLGGTICYNWTDGKAGGCFEWGAGLGGGLDIQPFADPPGNSSEAGVNVKVGVGPVALDGDIKVDECDDFSGGLNINLGPLQVPIFEATNAKVGGNPQNLMDKKEDTQKPNKEASSNLTLKVELKGTIKKCRKW